MALFLAIDESVTCSYWAQNAKCKSTCFTHLRRFTSFVSAVHQVGTVAVVLSNRSLKRYNHVTTMMPEIEWFVSECQVTGWWCTLKFRSLFMRKYGLRASHETSLMAKVIDKRPKRKCKSYYSCANWDYFSRKNQFQMRNWITWIMRIKRYKSDS